MAELSIAPGSTSQSIDVFLTDTSVTTGAGKTGIAFNTSGLVAYYHRPGSNPVAISLVTQTVTGTYTAGGFVELSSANMPGEYRLDVPDAAFVSGVRYVIIMLSGAAGANHRPLTIDLTNEAKLSNGITHGGNTAVLQLEHAVIASTTTNTAGLSISGSGSGPGLQLQGGITANGFTSQGGSTSGHGAQLVGGAVGAGLRLQGGSTSGDAAQTSTTSGHGINVGCSGTLKHALNLVASSTSGNAIQMTETVPNGPVPDLGILAQGTPQSVSTTQCVLAAAETFADNTLIGSTIWIYGSTQGYWQVAVIASNVGSTDTVTYVTALQVAPTGTLIYKIFGTATTGSLLDTSLSGHTTAGTMGAILNTLPTVSAGTNGGLPTVDSSGAVKVQSGTGANQINLSSGSVTVGTNSDKTGYTVSTVSDKTGYSLASSQTFNTSGSVGSVTGAVASVTAVVSANITKINGTTVNGNGSSPAWGP